MLSEKRALQVPDPHIRIRPVRIADVPTLQRDFWPERNQASIQLLVSRAQQIAHQGRGFGIVAIHTERENLIGYGQLTLWPRGAEISDLFVTADCRGQGIGTTMIQYLVRAAREMHVPLIEIGAAHSNPNALALYRNLGFVDDYTLMLDLGNGPEPVTYLRLEVPTGR